MYILSLIYPTVQNISLIVSRFFEKLFQKLNNNFKKPKGKRKFMTFLIQPRMYMYVHIYRNPQLRAGCATKSIFTRSIAGLNSIFHLLNWLPKPG